MITRLFVIVFTAVSIASWWSTPTSAQTAQDQVRNANTDRPGFDYANFDIFPAPPFLSAEANCMERCRRDLSAPCLAWTFVKPGIQGPNARCWLKNRIPAARANNCCVSGVDPKPNEPDTNRPGSDYLSFDLVGNDQLVQCVGQCSSRPKCVAWTFVRAGVQGPRARCWLKNALPAAQFSGCCISGISQRVNP